MKCLASVNFKLWNFVICFQKIKWNRKTNRLILMKLVPKLFCEIIVSPFFIQIVNAYICY